MRKIFLIIFVPLIYVNILAQPDLNIAYKLSQPLDYLSVPLQNNFEYKVGPNKGFRWTLNLMPMFPIKISEKFNFLNRIVLPIIHQSDIYIANSKQTGIGDLLVNSFISTKPNSTSSIGLGPSFYFPIGSEKELSSKKYAAGPGIIASFSSGRLIVAGLLFHLWSFAGDKLRPDFSFFYFQPLMTYSFNDGWGAGFTTEFSTEFNKKETLCSIILTGSKMINFFGSFINIIVGPKFYFGNSKGPDSGFRLTLNLLYP